VTSRSSCPHHRTSRPKSLSLGVDYGYPISEFQGLRIGLSLQSSELLVGAGSAEQAVDWVRSNGSPTTTNIPEQDFGNGFIVPATTIFTSQFNSTFEFVAGWSYDTRNRAIFATRGTRHALSLSATIPGSEVEYYVASYDFLKLLPIYRSWTLAFSAEVAYGDALGSTTALPPFRQFFAGGPGSVRSFTESRLGPKDSFGNPYGGNLKVVGQTELIFPVPEKWRASTRISLFYDIGNVFSQGQGINFVGIDRQTPVTYEFDYNELKQSVGVAVQWLAPLGIFRFSYGVPLNANESDGIRYKDETEGFQFTVGSAF
jgi:outer membrane protein insertion porin family